MTYDAIVLGIGGMGSAAVYHLAKRRRKVLGLEQFNIGHDLGSSHGVNRIIRLAYAEDPRYVPLLRRSYELWREIENLTNERLLVITGGIDAGPETGVIIPGSLRACREHSLPHEVLDSSSLRLRFPGYRFPSKMIAVYQQDAGFVLSERAIIAYVMAAQALGAEIRAREQVLRWEIKKGYVKVHTNRNSYRTRHLVVTAGAWAGKTIPALQKARMAVPERQVLIWTQPLRPQYFQPGSFPIFNMEGVEEVPGRYYGFPIFQFPWFKLGKYHHLGEEVDPDGMNRECSLQDEEVLRRAIRKYFPDADGPTMAMKTCLFTNSPDEHFILDLHPETPLVSIAAGFSGHGFKFCSVVGEIMADFALEGECDRFDLRLFRINRKMNPLPNRNRAAETHK
ncbi:MAG TPA: N-methyl-L-tryptophan oxidase [Candidatus Angelobacter sp.]|nr:N-methyl-L-tryptophan oxidase [Candidatus Angelobacter sp.]